jgi:uncharacterized protein (TIGR00266 family)
MDVQIRNRPSFAHLMVRMNPGDRMVAEAGAMASMDPSVSMQARWNGGFFGAIARRVAGGESLFVNDFVATAPGHIVLTQPVPGDIACVDLQGESLYLQPGAFLACEPTVRLSVSLAGFASWIGAEGLFRLKVQGVGRVWFGAHGAIFSREVDGQYIVDSGHLVAYDPTLSLHVGASGGIFSTLFGGEGLVTRMRGRGRIYLQSRSLSGLAAWTNSHLYA